MKNSLGKILIFILFSIYLNANSYFNPTFDLSLSKYKVYVGEPIHATLTLKYNSKLPILNTNFEEFIASNFWIKELEESSPIITSNITSIKYTFIIFPQISGNLTINPQLIKVANREAKTNLIIWNKLYSTKQNITVSALPKDINIVGNYKISAKVDKTKIEANQPINLTLSIKGDGNFDDIKPFKINFKNILNFTAKPLITTDFKDGKYKGGFIQQFSLIADKDFNIPTISFTYFNTDTKMVETLQTKPFNIEIQNAKLQDTKEIGYIKYIYIVIGFILAMSTIYIFNFLKKKIKRNSLPIVIKIKKTKSDKQLYTLLLPYCEQYNLSNIMLKLEENIYNKGKNKINKQETIDSI